MQYAPSIVANAFLWKHKDHSLSHMKLQKLVFFVHAWGLAFHGLGGSPLSEKPKAWQHGPVFQTLYHQLKHNGSNPVSEYLKEIDPTTGRMVALVPANEDERFWTLFDRVWQRYGGMSAADLSRLTHERGGPWERVRVGQYGSDMPDDAIRAFYASKLTAAQPQ